MEDVQDDEGTRILRRAKEIIEQRGWGQRGGVRDEGPTCVSLAIGSAELESYPYTSSSKIRALYEAGNRICHVIGTSDVVGWNDYAGRSVEEVLQAFDKAIALRPPY